MRRERPTIAIAKIIDYSQSEKPQSTNPQTTILNHNPQTTILQSFKIHNNVWHFPFKFKLNYL